MPIEKLENGTWLHAGRLPLGGGWSGQCTAPGHAGAIPSQQELQEYCNLGYAERCGRLPQERLWDSVRFTARTFSDGKTGVTGRIQLRYVCERGHLPAEHGLLEFDVAEARWQESHRDSRVQRMAECFLQAYMEKRKSPEIAQVAS